MPTREDAPLRPLIVLGACEAPAARAPAARATSPDAGPAGSRGGAADPAGRRV
jgi:hypothetical protein